MPINMARLQNEQSININNVLFKRQFILGESLPTLSRNWINQKVGNHYFLSYHPDLEFAQVRNNYIELTLLGFILDPYQPEASNVDILNKILSKDHLTIDIPQHTISFGGRWILFVTSESDTFAISDPCGLRSIFYGVTKQNNLWCGSSPTILSKELNVEVSDDIKKSFLNSSYVKGEGEYWWPGNTTAFENIFRVLPNHSLYLRTRATKRFWPMSMKRKVSLKDAVDQASFLLKGLLNAASSRYNLAITMTAGIDSRTIFAASKNVAEKAYYHSMLIYNLSENSKDVSIPSRLLSKLGYQHHVLDCAKAEPDKLFHFVYEQSNGPSHIAWEKMAYGLHRHYPQNYICVKGNISEIARCEYHKYYHPTNISPKYLAGVVGMQDNSFATNAFEIWLNDIETLSKRTGYKILDLFYWEQRCGSWQATNQAEWDIVQEVFTPFNCRLLLEILLGVDEYQRKPPRFRLHKEIIKSLWPEALFEPINPQSINLELFKYLKYYAMRLGLIQLLRKINTQ